MEPKTVYVKVTYKGASANMNIQLHELQEDDSAGNWLIREALKMIAAANEQAVGG